MGASSWRSGAWALLAGALLFGGYLTVGHLDGGFPIHQIGANLPPPEMRTWWALWWVVGLLCVFSLGRALFVATDDADRQARLRDLWAAGADRSWIAGCSLLAFSLSAAVCWGALGGRHLVVDESAYLFMARLIGSGRLYAESYPDPGFYDRGFMVNDGKMYAQYFVGWPAMLAPFARFGLEQWANPVWFAAAVPGVFGVLRRLVGSSWARLGAVLYATAPFLVFGAATQMAHVACAFWLVWAFWFALRADEDTAPPWAAAGLALAFCGAFFVRPTTGLGIGGPILLWWIWRRSRRVDGQRLRDGLAFLLPAVLLGGAFLLVDQIQTGDPLVVAYTRFRAYSLESPFVQDVPKDARIFDFSETWRVLTGPFSALFRLNYALLGWPSSFLFVPFALRGPRGGLFLASALGMLGVHLFVEDPGIMAYGPVHYLEMIVPVVFLTVLGIRELSAVEVPAWAGRAVLSVVAALIVVSLAGYWPWRLQNLGRIGAATALPYALVQDKGPSVVFLSNGRWLPHCVDEQVHAFHVSRPDNPPDLDARILWVNHVSVVHDQGFLALHYPDRAGWILDWDEACKPMLLDLSTLGPDDFPSFFRPKGLERFDHLLPAAPEGAP